MPVNPRRQTLAGAGSGGRPRAPLPPSSKPPGGGGSGAGSIGSASARRRIPKGRKSMIPRVGSSAGGESTNNRENEPNGRRQSGIAAPSPSRGRRPPAARKSLGGAILQSGGHGHHGGATPAKNRRVSLAPSQNNASSVDPRDVKDKSYLTAAIRKTVSYLQSRGYPDASTLNVRQLVTSGPSGRDFQNIMTFLFRRVDPGFHRPPQPGKQRSDETVIKFEDEVSMAFRCLGYPYPISKTGLVAVGSPHTWPALIAALDWLVDVLTIRDGEVESEWGPDASDLAQGEEEKLLTLAGSSERVGRQFHKFLRKSMVAFLNDDNEDCAELEGTLLDEFQKDSEGVEAYLTGLDEECGRMREEIARLDAEGNGLSEAQQQQEKLAGKIEHFLTVIDTMTAHKRDLTEKLDTLQQEKATMEREMSDHAMRIDQLKATIGNQELSQEDVRRMEREKARVEEQVAKQAKALAGQRAAVAEAKEKWEAVYALLERDVQEYNARARDLELVPKTAKHAEGKDYEVRLDKRRAAEGATALLGGVDVEGTVKPHVKKVAAGYHEEMVTVKERTAEMEDQIAAAEGECERLVEEIEAIADKIASCNEAREATTEEMEAEIRDKRRQLDLLTSKIASLNDPAGVEATVAKYEAERAALERRQREQAEEYSATKRAVNDEIRRALEAVKEHEAHVSARLKEMNSHVEKRKEECERIKLLDS